MGVSLWIPLSGESQESLQPVVIESEKEKERDALSSGKVVPVSDEFKHRSVGDALHGIPGVQLFQSGGEGRRVSLSIRGMENQQVQVFWEDVPLNMGLGGGVDLSEIPVYGTDTIDVYRGGNALLGASALGGALSIHGLDPPEESRGDIGVRGGAFGTLGAHLSGGGRVGTWGWFSGIETKSRRGNFQFIDHNGRERERLNNGSREGSWMGKLKGKIGKSNTLSSSVWVGLSDREMPGAEQFPTEDARLMNQRMVFSNGWEHRFGESVVGKIGLWAHHRKSVYSSSSSFLSGALDNEMNDLSGGGLFSYTFLGFDDLILSWHSDWSLEEARIDLSGRETAPSRIHVGTMGNMEWSFFRERFLWSAGSRLDWISDQSLTLLPKTSLRYSPFSLLSFTWNGSRAYRPPSFEELYFEYGSIRGNPDLGAEKAWSTDFEIQIGSSETYLTSGVFAIWIENVILFLPTSAFVVEATDSKSSTSRGWEVEGGIPFGRHGFISVAYTFTDVRFVDTDKGLPGRSPHVFFGKLGWKAEPFRVWAEAKWRSEFPLDRFGSLREEGRGFVDLFGDFALSPDFLLGIEARNLLDKKDAVNSLLQPLPGRSVFVTASLSL